MYNVILVDDEPLVKVALKSLIDWEACGYHICATAANGEEALELIHMYQPQIVITDLKMPVLDGLELIKNLTLNNYPCKIIVLSNYSDYNSVREALKLGAVDYLLKIKLQPEELLSQLKNCIELLNPSIISAEQQQVFYPLIWKEMFFSSEISDNAKKYLSSYKDFFIIYLQWENNITRKDEEKISTEHIQNLLPEISSIMHIDDIVSLRDQKLLIILQKKDLENNDISLHDLCLRIHNYLERFLQLNVILLYSPLIPDYQDIISYFSDLKKKLHISYYKSSCCISAENVHLQHYLNYPNYREFSEAFLNGCKSDPDFNIKTYYMNFLQHCSKFLIAPELVKAYICKVLNYLDIFLINTHIEDLQSTEEKIMNSLSVSETQQLLEQIFFNIAYLLQDKTPLYRRETVICLNYLNNNYTKKISLSDISTHVSMNDKYLCRIFKEDTKMSIIQYLNQLKITHAAELLQNTDMRIKEVADAVGITDPFYFNRLFKKHFGVSPSVFQKASSDDSSEK